MSGYVSVLLLGIHGFTLETVRSFFNEATSFVRCSE